MLAQVEARKPPASVLPACTVAVAEGDGIGPEITAAVLRILKAADPRLSFEPVLVGLKAYQAGALSGFGPEVMDAITRHGVILKGPITTPQGGGLSQHGAQGRGGQRR